MAESVSFWELCVVDMILPRIRRFVIKQTGQQQDQINFDLNLIERSQHDPDAFRPLYEKYFKQIFLFVHRRVGDRETTADITSQVFLKALVNIGKYTFKGLPFSSWLYRIALNECNSYFRTNKRHRVVSIQEEMVHHLYEELMSDNRSEDLLQKLPLILGRLETKDLQIIELRFFEQRPFREIADIIGITETYAKVRVYRALARMKKLFLDHL